MDLRLHSAQDISRRSHLHNAHKDVDVGRMVVNKASIVTLTISIVPILQPQTLFTFCCHIYAIDYLDSCLDHLITLFF